MEAGVPEAGVPEAGVSSSFFGFQKPEVTTVVRWMLRVVLVLFLAWLVRRRPDEEEEEEDEKEPRRTATGAKGRGAPAARPNARQHQQQPNSTHRYPAQREYANNRGQGQQDYQMRQRRPGDGNGSIDVDAVIDKMSKPKEMWQVHRDEKGASQVSTKRPSDPAGSHKESSLFNIVASLNGSVDSTTGSNVGGGAAAAPTGRKPLQLKSSKLEAARLEKEAEAKATLHGHERPVTFITWNRECNLLFTCGKDKIVCAWSFPEGEALGVYHGHSGAVWACSVTSDSRWLVSSGADRNVIVWEARTSRELARVELPGVVRFVEWASAPGGDREAPTERFVTSSLRFGSHPAALTVWRFDGETIENLLTIDTLPTAANQVRWGRGDYLLASCHDNGELIFWRADTGAEVRRLQASSSSISKFDFSSDKEVVATASLDKMVKVWDLGKGTEWKLLYEAKTDRPLNAVALGPFTRSQAVAAPGKRPTSVYVIAAGGQDARDVAIKGGAAEDQFGTLLFHMGDQEAHPAELKAGGVTKGHFGPVHTLAFSRDGTAMASGSEDGCVRFHFFKDDKPEAVGKTASMKSEPAEEPSSATAPAATTPPATPPGQEVEPTTNGTTTDGWDS